MSQSTQFIDAKTLARVRKAFPRFAFEFQRDSGDQGSYVANIQNRAASRGNSQAIQEALLCAVEHRFDELDFIARFGE